MKKTLSLITGILFVTIGLHTQSCNNLDKRNPSESSSDTNNVKVNKKKVEIQMTYFKWHGGKHLLLHDSNGGAVVDSLTTDVKPGSTVTWKLDNHSGIKEIDSIYFVRNNHRIVLDDPKRIYGNQFELKIPEDAQPDTFKYIIIVITKKLNEIVELDPYIRVPPPQDTI